MKPLQKEKEKGCGMKILLAEDDDSIRTIADLSLRRVGGHEVVRAQDGNQTLLLVKKERPDFDFTGCDDA